MSENTIISLNRISFLFSSLNVFFFRNKFSIRFPIIRAYFPLYFRFNFLPEFFSRLRPSCANFAIDKSFPISINSNPYPNEVFFDPMYVCISSISTTSISFELRSSSIACPKDFIQLNTATWLTFRNRPMERNPKPSRYKIKASRLSLIDLPICSTGFYR